MMPNIDDTEGHRIKTINYPRHETQRVIYNPTNRNPYKYVQENSITVFGPHLYNSMTKYLREMRSVKTVNRRATNF